MRWESSGGGDSDHFAELDDGRLELLVWRLLCLSPVLVMVVIILTRFQLCCRWTEHGEISPLRRLRAPPL